MTSYISSAYTSAKYYIFLPLDTQKVERYDSISKNAYSFAKLTGVATAVFAALAALNYTGNLSLLSNLSIASKLPAVFTVANLPVALATAAALTITALAITKLFSYQADRIYAKINSKAV